ncbi:hypothetical protein [Variovorax rhizosphaerae]|uniref:Uncharacterized protein n=1 Tax=Variovorax rhizosphaerae TaxID=1836200 RepID=A0ABU8WJH4_9BURK
MTETTQPAQFFTKLGAAIWQLDRAIALFLDEADYACAITLAGAADEILGKLLDEAGKTHALGQFLDLCSYLDPTTKRKAFVSLANARRDDLKHITHGGGMAVTRDDAVEMLDRAVSNHQSLTGGESPSILRYMARPLS